MSALFELEAGEVRDGFGEFETHRLQLVAQDLRDGQIAEPLTIRRDHVPGPSFGAALAHHVLVRVGILVPILALLQVGRGEFPVLGLVVDALAETLRLLVLVDVEQKLHDARAVLVQHAFEIVDLGVSLAPYGFRHDVMDAHYQYVLIMRTVEDSDLDRRAVLVQHAFEIVDLGVSLAPYGFRHDVMDAHYQYVLIMRTVEDSDLARSEERRV